MYAIFAKFIDICKQLTCNINGKIFHITNFIFLFITQNYVTSNVDFLLL